VVDFLAYFGGTYVATVLGIAGLLKIFDYFERERLRNWLGPYWGLLVFGVPLLAASIISTVHNRVSLTLSLGGASTLFMFAIPALLTFLLVALGLIIRAKRSTLATSVRPRVVLRSTPKACTPNDIVEMIKANGFSHPEALSKYGLSPRVTTGIPHSFEVKAVGDCDVVTDRATGLMWQKLGSVLATNHMGAKEFITNLNKGKYAGYEDWRLPTIEELTSLLQPTKNEKGTYTDTLFDADVVWCWSADGVLNSLSYWYVDFSNGLVDAINLLVKLNARAVRSMKELELRAVH